MLAVCSREVFTYLCLLTRSQKLEISCSRNHGIFPMRQSGSGPEVEDRKSRVVVPPAAGCKVPPAQPTKL